MAWTLTTDMSLMLRDGTMRGGGGFYYTVGSYTCSGGKWKGEMTSQEHSPISIKYLWAGKVLSIGFTGTYSDDAAEFEATALAGKRSFRFKSVYRLLFADCTSCSLEHFKWPLRVADGNIGLNERVLVDPPIRT
jgi:hypothetical protein